MSPPPRTRKRTQPKPEPEKKTRRKVTPRERAEEALSVEQRRVETLTDRRDRLKAELEPIEEELAKAIKRRDFLAQSPDLEEDVVATESQPDSVPES